MQTDMKDLACFFYIVNGEYEAVEANGVYSIGSKEALIKKCGRYLGHFMQTEKHQTCEAVAVYLYPDVLKEAYKNQVPAFLKGEYQPHPPKKMIANELLEKYINNLLVYFDNPELIDDDLAILKIKELVMILLKSEHYASVVEFLKHIFSPTSIEFTAVIENNIFSNISLDELAFITNKSLSSFKREFKKLYHETPAKYIKNRRLSHAADLLVSVDEPISRIAFQCGFQDPTTFSQAFMEKFGTSPSQFRLTKSRKKLA